MFESVDGKGKEHAPRSDLFRLSLLAPAGAAGALLTVG
jgi:hypothetical protein